MRLHRLRLQNFRQHVDNTIEFRPGLTGIIGPNGAGKTTILEAIAWAIYGAAAARGTNDTIRFARAAPRARVAAELTFELENHEYRVVRALNSAEVYLDNGLNPVATGVGTTTSYLQSRLGMTRQEFFNTYFTGQKELQFLAQLGPADRSRFLAQVLGYERLRRAQNLGIDRRKQLRAEIDGLKSGLPDPISLQADGEAAGQRVKQAKKALAQAEKARANLVKEVATLTPAWNAAQAARERSRELIQQADAAQRELANAQRELQRAQAEVQKVAAAEAELAAIKPQLAELDRLTLACEQLDEHAIRHERRVALTERQTELNADLTAIVARLEQIGRAPELLLQTEQEIEQGRVALAEAEAEVTNLRTAWNRDVQDVKTQLRFSATTGQELEQRIQSLNKTGKHGPCPVCTRTLADEFDTVLQHLEEELEKMRQNERWLTQRDKQLAQIPAALAAAEKSLAELRDAMEKRTERLARCQQATGELWERTGQRRLKERNLAQVEEELAGLPAGYDRAEHEALKAQLAQLRAIAQKASVLEHEVASGLGRATELKAAQERAQAATQRSVDIKSAQVDLKFDEQQFTEAKERFDKARVAADAAKLTAAEATQILRAAEEVNEAAQRALAAYAEKHEKLSALESDFRHHNEMDSALTRLRTELNARVRPELAELASAFLSEITDGRYNALEIDENYNVLVLEDGEEKPVISGGEEDVANLVLRIAISQMIAERAGQRLSTLFLDEVFGSLDLERRDNVIQLLQKLQDRFEQVVLITHVETVREGLDHVIRLEYDERSGTSVVKEDVFSPEPALWERESVGA
jgi:exonuclease SbcC